MLALVGQSARVAWLRAKSQFPAVCRPNNNQCLSINHSMQWKALTTVRGWGAYRANSSGPRFTVQKGKSGTTRVHPAPSPTRSASPACTCACACVCVTSSPWIWNLRSPLRLPRSSGFCSCGPFHTVRPCVAVTSIVSCSSTTHSPWISSRPNSGKSCGTAYHDAHDRPGLAT